MKKIFLLLFTLCLIVGCNTTYANVPVPDRQIQGLKGPVKSITTTEANLHWDSYSSTRDFFDKDGFLQRSDKQTSMKMEGEPFDENNIEYKPYTMTNYTAYMGKNTRTSSSIDSFSGGDREKIERSWRTKSEYIDTVIFDQTSEFQSTLQSTTIGVLNEKGILISAEKNDSMKTLPGVVNESKVVYTYDTQDHVTSEQYSSNSGYGGVTFKIVNGDIDKHGNVLKRTYYEDGKVEKIRTYTYEYY